MQVCENIRSVPFSSLSRHSGRGRGGLLGSANSRSNRIFGVNDPISRQNRRNRQNRVSRRTDHQLANPGRVINLRHGAGARDIPGETIMRRYLSWLAAVVIAVTARPATAGILSISPTGTRGPAGPSCSEITPGDPTSAYLNLGLTAIAADRRHADRYGRLADRDLWQLGQQRRSPRQIGVASR